LGVIGSWSGVWGGFSGFMGALYENDTKSITKKPFVTCNDLLHYLRFCNLQKNVTPVLRKYAMVVEVLGYNLLM